MYSNVQNAYISKYIVPLILAYCCEDSALKLPIGNYKVTILKFISGLLPIILHRYIARNSYNLQLNFIVDTYKPAE